ncbi:N-terminal half of MaoC dehydratase [Thermomonospora echinospora]|uniref:N-terminal half of MaoC dehydratase n=1 Tax=Thermomonospora echinospora TaxID=1992 RepID=A0A1H6E2P6_9ACTN|nr:MaoC family dehydratase N-terminal domain-containing protein [Thermomonospora echinospora]SEG91463.1 N-terminal half of MaoC dehydratase [Thermomonospora echinospora]
MAIDTSVIGTTAPELTVDVERGRLRSFAHAIGETDPIYTDVDAARAAGHPDLPVPPTFLFCLEMDRPDPFGWLDGLGVDLRRVLHGEQRFTYRTMAHAGDRLTLAARIGDVYAKRGGALEFIVRSIDVTRDAVPIAELASVIVVQNPEAGQ